MKCSPWFSTLGVARGANDPIPEKFTATKPWRRPRPAQSCSASEEVGEQIDIEELVICLEQGVRTDGVSRGLNRWVERAVRINTTNRSFNKWF
jgi:hypothetical protein